VALKLSAGLEPPRSGSAGAAPGARTRAAGFRSVLARGRPRAVVALLGPAFVAAVAYVDPGNFATNFSAGARFGYGLVWVVVAANLMAMLVQYLSAKVGVATGRDLPELCRDRLPRAVSRGLWVQAELVAMASSKRRYPRCSMARMPNATTAVTSPAGSNGSRNSRLSPIWAAAAGCCSWRASSAPP
jgi:hypothetical protein